MLKPLCLCLMLAACSGALGHGGGLDANGCHTNRRTGDYHCHQGPGAAPPSPQRLAPDDPPQRRGRQAQAASPTPAPPSCYVGPRGGTYTITKSGRKNYRGC